MCIIFGVGYYMNYTLLKSYNFVCFEHSIQSRKLKMWLNECIVHSSQKIGLYIAFQSVQDPYWFGTFICYISICPFHLRKNVIVDQENLNPKALMIMKYRVLCFADIERNMLILSHSCILLSSLLIFVVESTCVKVLVVQCNTKRTQKAK